MFAASLTLFACGKVLGIDSPNGNAGQGAAGSFSGNPGDGGTAGTGTGGRTEDAGEGGRADDGGAGAETRDGGTGGIAAVSEPTLHGVCSKSGAFACAASNANLILECDEGAWIAAEFCPADTRCSGAIPQCREVVPECYRNGGSRCEGDLLYDCGSDWLALVERQCPFGCSDRQCLPGRGDQLVIHEQVVASSVQYWRAAIPVCLRVDPDVDLETQAEEWRISELIRAELETTWQRYADVEFSGWDACPADPTGVVLDLVPDCVGRLGNAVRPGEANQLSVEICTSYQDAKGNHPESSDRLLRLLGRHQFMHVLGFSDLSELGYSSMMRRVVQESEVDDLQPSAYDLENLEYVYQRKPSGTLVTPTGRCLSFIEGAIRPRVCDSSFEQTWMVLNTDLINLFESGGLALMAPDVLENTPLSLEVFDGEPGIGWEIAHAQWNTPGRCVGLQSHPAAAGVPLVTENCLDVGDPSQSWRFQRLGFDNQTTEALTQIVWSDSNLCVVVPSATDTVLRLEDCAGANTATSDFVLSFDGFIRHGDGCVSWIEPNSVLRLSSTCDHHSTWQLSAAIEWSDPRQILGDRWALTLLDPSSPNAAATATPLDGLPGPGQVFDVYF